MLVTGLTAQGNSQATGLNLPGLYNVFSTVAASTGAVLPFAPSGGEDTEVMVRNGGASALSVYPPVNYKINNGATNAAVSVAAGAVSRFVREPSTGNWWQV